MDLIALVFIGFTVTVICGLLLVGFISAPWVIGLVLLLLLVALMRISTLDSEQEILTGMPKGDPSVSNAPASDTQPPKTPQQNHSDPNLVYRGAKYHAEAHPQTPGSIHGLVYRGAKYSPAESQEQEEVLIAGKYRGSPWQGGHRDSDRPSTNSPQPQ